MRRASLSSQGATAGIASASPTIRLHAAGAEEMTQPKSSRSMEAIGTRLRRRLSSMRQRLIMLSGLRALWPLRGRHAPKNPSCNLPVAANPAMLALAEAGVVERHVFEQLDVGGETHAHMRAFDQVVAQQRFGRKAVAQAFVERGDVVDGFAVKDGFAEQFLLRVGNRLSVRIGPGGVRKDARKSAGGGARKADADARLNDRVAAPPDLGHRIEHRQVQRMSDGRNHLPRRARRQLRVRIEGDDVSHRHRQIPGELDVSCAFAPQKQIEIFDFSALALAPDPALLGLRPDPAAVKEQKPSAGIPAVQIVDAVTEWPSAIPHRRARWRPPHP